MANWLNKYKAEIAIVIGGTVCIHLFLFARSFNDWSFQINSKTAADFGQFVGGYVGTLVLLISVVLLYATLRNQRETFQIQQFENKFFEMLKIVRDNSSEVESKGKKGRRVFIDIKGEIQNALGIINNVDEMGVLPEDWRLNFAYLVVFYGIDDISIGNLVDVLEVERQKEVANDVIYAISFEHNAIEDYNSGRNAADKKYLVFDGHQSRLGHYFRQLFQTVNFADEQEFLTYAEKYWYIRTLRAQLSTHEQAIFFFNSLSTIGAPWEKDKTEDNAKLITKYNLIKNIPDGFIKGVEIREYYPDVRYEGEGNTERRKELESRYS